MSYYIICQFSIIIFVFIVYYISIIHFDITNRLVVGCWRSQRLFGGQGRRQGPISISIINTCYNELDKCVYDHYR